METITGGIKEFLFERGDLHDCKVSNVNWSFKPNRLEVLIPDLNANFLGLPEYSGQQPGRLICDGVQSIQIDDDPSGGGLRIYEATFYVGDGLQVIELLFSPSGKLVVHSMAVSFEIGPVK